MTQTSYGSADHNDKNWSYRTSVQALDRILMGALRRTPSLLPSVAERLVARDDWVAACEVAVEIQSVTEFLDWMDRFVRPLIGYRVLACGTGVFLAQGVNVDRLLLRGIHSQDAERLRDAVGTVVLPRARGGIRGGLQPVDLAPLAVRVWADRPPRVIAALRGAAMERSTGSRQRGSYFLFGAAPRAIEARAAYSMRLLAPQMHDALLVALASERQGRNEREPTMLTRTERQLLEYLVAGRTTPDIARETFRSTHTVANQVRNIIFKLRASNRTEAIAKALGLGLVASVDKSPYTRITLAQGLAPYIVKRKPRALSRYWRIWPMHWPGGFIR